MCYLVHILFHDRREIGARLVVSKEGPLEGSLIQEINGFGFEFSVFVRHPDQHGDTPALRFKSKSCFTICDMNNSHGVQSARMKRALDLPFGAGVVKEITS